MTVRHLTIVPPARPKTRAERVDGPRPCPFASCRHHLLLEISRKTGFIRFQAEEPEQLVDTCSLDVADRGGLLRKDVARQLGVSSEQVRRIEEAALRKLGRTRSRELLPMLDEFTAGDADAVEIGQESPVARNSEVRLISVGEVGESSFEGIMGTEVVA